MKRELFFIFLVVFSIAGVAHASLVIQNQNGNPLENITIQLLPNNTALANFTLCSIGENTTQGQMKYFGNFNVVFSQSSVLNLTQDSCQAVNITLSIDLNTTAGQYHDFIAFISPTDYKEVGLTVNVLESSVWSISPNGLGVSLDPDTAGKLTDFTIKNTGNLDIDFHMNILNNAGVVWVDTSPFTLNAFKSLTRPIYYIVSHNSTPQNLSINISVSDASGNVKVLPLNISVYDNTPPMLSDFTYDEEISVGQNELFSVTARDNYRIQYVKIEVAGKIMNMTQDTLNGDGSHYYLIYNNTKAAGNVPFKLIASDGTDSTNITGQFVIKALDTLSINANNNFGKMMFLHNSTIKIGETTGKTYYTVKLKNIVYSASNASVIIKINGNELFGNTLAFNESGQILLSIQEREMANVTNYPYDYFFNFQGELQITTDSTVKNPSPIVKFFGEFSSYEVTLPMNVEIPVFINNNIVNANMTCEPMDVGVYQNSTYECRTSYPIDVGQELKVMMSISSYNADNQGHLNKEQSLQSRLDAATFWELLFLSVFLLGVFVVAVYWWVIKDMHRH